MKQTKTKYGKMEQIVSNLKPYNSTDKTTFKFQSSSAIKQFCSTLKKAGISVTVRTQFGSEISAACGQLCYENEL